MLSQQETKGLIGELSSRMTDHRGKVHQLLCSKPLRHPEVAPLILVGLAAERPIESNFFPGLLEGLLGSLGIAATGESNPPSSSREGAGHAWSTALGVAISQIKQKDVKVPEKRETTSRPGPCSPGRSPREMMGPATTTPCRPALHTQHGQGGVRGS